MANYEVELHIFLSHCDYCDTRERENLCTADKSTWSSTFSILMKTDAVQEAIAKPCQCDRVQRSGPDRENVLSHYQQNCVP